MKTFFIFLSIGCIVTMGVVYNIAQSGTAVFVDDAHMTKEDATVPAIQTPQFVSTQDILLPGDILGVFIDIDGDKRFYPYTILIWHQVINDTVGGQPLIVTFCPLCGSGTVYSRMIDEEVYDFRVADQLHQGMTVMYDTQTHSLWDHASGAAFEGDLGGVQLDYIPVSLLTYSEVLAQHPDVVVLSSDTGYDFDYTYYPYGDHLDSIGERYQCQGDN